MHNAWLGTREAARGDAEAGVAWKAARGGEAIGTWPN